MYRGTLLDFLNMGSAEIMIIMVVVLLLFGGKKLPELARGLGKGLRDFKDASEGVKREIHRNINAVDVVDDLKSSIYDEPTTGTTDSNVQARHDEEYPSTLEEEYYGHAAVDTSTPEETAESSEVAESNETTPDTPEEDKTAGAQTASVRGSKKETTNI
jgi:TatA/E family protein of Tat protein translocase